MACISPKDIAEHEIIHELMGVGTSVPQGPLTIINGYPVFNDPSRGDKTLTIARNTFSAGKSGKAKNVYLFTEDRLSMNKTGVRMARKGTITMISVQNSTSNTFTLEVRRNGVLTSLASVVVTAALGNEDVSVNVDFNQGDLLQFYIDGTARDPHAWIEVAWRVT